MEIRWGYNTLNNVTLKPYIRKKNTHTPELTSPQGKMKKCVGIIVFILCCFYLFIYIQVSSREGEADSGDVIRGTVIGWAYNTSRETSQYILSNTSFVPKTFCESPSLLLIIVCSAPAHNEARIAIRDTWGSEKNISGSLISLYFLMGATSNISLQQDIMEENNRFNDIVQEHFIDSYNNLTLKSVTMLKLVSSYCANTIKFLLKIDDDMFLNAAPLVKLLHQKKNTKDILLGSLICNARPIKDYSSKWYAPKYMYPGKFYPNYLSGTGYLMSVDLVPKLYEAALQTPIFHLEDVYITGICSKVINVKPHNHPGFTYQQRKFDACIFKDVITVHNVTPVELRKFYVLFKVTDLTEVCRVQQETMRNNFSVNQWILNHFVNRKPVKRLCY